VQNIPVVGKALGQGISRPGALAPALAIETGGFLAGEQIAGTLLGEGQSLPDENPLETQLRQQGGIGQAEPTQQQQMSEIQQEAALRDALAAFGIDFDELVANADQVGATRSLI
jgi:hypothetical protein